MEVLVVPAFDVLRVMLPVAPCRELPELREMAPPFADGVSSTVDPAVMVKLPPVPLVASPTASVMDPPVPEAEEPVTTEMEPLVSELVPVDREIDPEEESVLVAVVLPVWISMTPDSLPLEPDAALDRMTLPEAPFVEAPLVMMMLPPSPAARSVSPAFHVKSAPPVPPLLPKVMVKEPMPQKIQKGDAFEDTMLLLEMMKEKKQKENKQLKEDQIRAMAMEKKFNMTKLSINQYAKL